MRIGWGYKILMLYLGFVGIILTLVFSSFNYEVEIVATDYYERETYQQDIIDGNFNLLRLGVRPEINISDEGVHIQLPDVFEGSDKAGELWLYHIMHKRHDYQIKFTEHADNYFFIPADQMGYGEFSLKLRWTQDDTPYYFEERVSVQ